MYVITQKTNIHGESTQDSSKENVYDYVLIVMMFLNKSHKEVGNWQYKCSLGVGETKSKNS